MLWAGKGLEALEVVSQVVLAAYLREHFPVMQECAGGSGVDMTEEMWKMI